MGGGWLGAVPGRQAESSWRVPTVDISRMSSGHGREGGLSLLEGLQSVLWRKAKWNFMVYVAVPIASPRRWINYLNKACPRLWGMALSGKCLLCEPEIPSLIPRTPVKETNGGKCQGSPELGKQIFTWSSRQMRDLVFKNIQMMSEGQHWRLSSDTDIQNTYIDTDAHTYTHVHTYIHVHTHA